MLQTCTRCRSRRIKCDSRLPACSNCAKSESECTFRDDALQEDIPRSYVQSLNDRVQELSVQLALHRSIRTGGHLYVLSPGAPSSEPKLDLSFPSLVAGVACEALWPPNNPRGASAPEMTNLHDGADVRPRPLPVPVADKSIVTPPVVRFLLGRYARRVRPRYDVLEPEVLGHDGPPGFKNMPDARKFRVLMACAVAAACESYGDPRWAPLAQVARDWAGELLPPIITTADEAALTAILLLLIFELVEPSRGLMWELLDLAVRLCLKLGWLHSPNVPAGGSPGPVDSSVVDERRLVSALRDIHRCIQTIFHRPSLLNSVKPSISSEEESAFSTHGQLYDILYGSGGLYKSRACPFALQTAPLLDALEALPLTRHHPIISQTWLLLLPLCVKHRQCAVCFQEPGELHDTRGMATLRSKVFGAASELISSVYDTATAADGFISPFVASARALEAGCCVLVGIAKSWIPLHAHMGDVIRCTEILTMFAPCWKGGAGYLQVWRALTGNINYGGLSGR